MYALLGQIQVIQKVGLIGHPQRKLASILFYTKSNRITVRTV
jgi:hypothetical protein